ncbi:MAG: FkbM family methyltransferase [Dehalococcoidia bacterium]
MSDGAHGVDVIEALIEALPQVASAHAPSGPLHALLSQVARDEVARRFGPETDGQAPFGPFGPLAFPYTSMGSISSLHLFGLDELILFSFYRANRGRYRRVADLGSNIGLHSLVLDRCGYEVRAFEPDPVHFDLLSRNLAANGATHVTPANVAVSIEDGEHEFVRVVGNTTGSHLSGAKANPYGELERFTVRLVGVAPLLEWADLLKIDIEGHEAELLCATTAAQWADTDAMVEIGTPENARLVFDHFQREGVHLFAQKIGWRRVTRVEDMPGGYVDGSLFITRRDGVPWDA